MSFAWYILWFIIAVSLLVTVHEFGHYWVARRLGFKVLRFSVGFGRPLWKRVAGRDRTEYVIAAIPLGGYVKLLDEREGPVPPEDLARSFTRRPPWQRIVVLLAGPFFNIGFAVLVLWAMFWVGGANEVKAVVGEVVPGSVAAQAGVRSQDEIVALDGKRVEGRTDVIFGLLDAVSDDGHVQLTVVGPQGARREATLLVEDRVERRRLTEPAALLEGLGLRFWLPPIPPVLGQVTEGGPAHRAGLRSGDRILAIDGAAIGDFADIPDHLVSKAGKTVEVQYVRDGTERTARVVAGSHEQGGRTVGLMQVGHQPVKIPPGMHTHIELSPFGALERATVKAWDMTVLQARLFWRMLLGQVSLKNLSGPLSIAEFAGDSAEAGFTAFLSFLVLISLSLGFLNLLPIPILDGGQIVFQLVEWLKGSPLSERAQALGQQVGIALLVLLMGVALFNDIARQFG
jgi:regulator of sigma E protease